MRTSTAGRVTRLAFEFLVLTASRSGEVRFARWNEINRETSTWHIPAERMKARRMHRVPLVACTLEILDRARGMGAEEDDGLIFPANRNGKPLSNMTFTEMLRRLEIPAAAHGFRWSFKSWATETRAATRHESEAALAHRIGDSETAEAYIHTGLLEPHRPLMEKWANFLKASTGTE